MATLKYFAQKTKDGYPVPSTMMGFKTTPAADTLVEILPQDYTALPGQSVSPPDSGLRYFVRRKADGSIIPNSLITGSKKPSGLVYEFKVITGTAIAAPSALSYTSPNVYTTGSAITSLTPTVTGAVDSYSVSPALPTGLSLNTTTGVISGTPTADTAEATYVVTATNLGGTATASIVITVNAA